MEKMRKRRIPSILRRLTSFVGLAAVTALLTIVLAVDLTAAEVGASAEQRSGHDDQPSAGVPSSSSVSFSRLKAFLSRRWEVAKVRLRVYMKLFELRWYGLDEPSLTTTSVQKTPTEAEVATDIRADTDHATTTIRGPFPPNRTLNLWFIRHGESFNNIVSKHLKGIFAAPNSFPSDPFTPLNSATRTSADGIAAPPAGKDSQKREREQDSTESLQFATGAGAVESGSAVEIKEGREEKDQMGDAVDPPQSKFTQLLTTLFTCLKSFGLTLLEVTSPVIARQRLLHLYHLVRTIAWMLWEELASLLSISEELQFQTLKDFGILPEEVAERLSFIETEFKHPGNGNQCGEGGVVHSSAYHRSRFINTPLTLVGESQAQQLRDFVLAHPEEFPAWFAGGGSSTAEGGREYSPSPDRVVYVSNLRRAVKTALLALEPVLCVHDRDAEAAAEDKNGRLALRWVNASRKERRLLRRSCTTWTPLRIHSDLQEKNSLVVTHPEIEVDAEAGDDRTRIGTPTSSPKPLQTIHHPSLDFSNHRGNAVGRKNLSARVDSFLHHILELHGVPRTPETQDEREGTDDHVCTMDDKSPVGVVAVGHNAWLRVLLRRHGADEELAKRGLDNCGVLRMQLQTDHRGVLTLSKVRRLFVPQ